MSKSHGAATSNTDSTERDSREKRPLDLIVPVHRFTFASEGSGYRSDKASPGQADALTNPHPAEIARDALEEGTGERAFVGSARHLP